MLESVRGDMKRIKIFFFGTRSNVSVRINKTATVSDLIRLAIDQFMSNPAMPKEKLRYPTMPQGNFNK
jgi:hypothetical protein